MACWFSLIDRRWQQQRRQRDAMPAGGLDFPETAARTRWREPLQGRME
ncbi:MAG: hypothetical protein ACOY4H_15905 [Thermodesulfobacteriota bacterium]